MIIEEIVLEPCPWCENRNVSLYKTNMNKERWDYSEYVQCNYCGATGPVGKEGSKAWDKRAGR